MRKLIASVAMVTAVAVGGLAVVAVNPLQLVSAKSSNDSATSNHSATSPDPSPGKGKGKGAKPAGRAHAGAKLLDQALDALVKKGTITQAQADAVKKAVKAEVTKVRKEHKGDHKGDHKRGFRKDLRHALIATSAKAIGITPADLVKDLRSGKSIAQVAQSKGVEVQKVVDAIVTAGNARIDAAVKAGKLDAAKAAKIKQRLPELAKKVVNKVPDHGGRGGNGGQKPGG